MSSGAVVKSDESFVLTWLRGSGFFFTCFLQSSKMNKHWREYRQVNELLFLDFLFVFPSFQFTSCLKEKEKV